MTVIASAPTSERVGYTSRHGVDVEVGVELVGGGVGVELVGGDEVGGWVGVDEVGVELVGGDEVGGDEVGGWVGVDEVGGCVRVDELVFVPVGAGALNEPPPGFTTVTGVVVRGAGVRLEFGRSPAVESPGELP